MSKKQYLELLIKTFGFVPSEIKTYRTSSCDGQFQVATGWEVAANYENGKPAFGFKTPEGFNDAVRTVIIKSLNLSAKPVYVD